MPAPASDARAPRDRTCPVAGRAPSDPGAAGGFGCRCVRRPTAGGGGGRRGLGPVALRGPAVPLNPVAGRAPTFIPVVVTYDRFHNRLEARTVRGELQHWEDDLGNGQPARPRRGQRGRPAPARRLAPRAKDRPPDGRITKGRGPVVPFVLLFLAVVTDLRPARTDGFGDPLPAGAVARLGSACWRFTG